MPPNIVAGRPLAEWETLIRSKIDGHLKNERFDSLVYEITEVEKIENYVIKKKGQDRIVQDPSGTTTFLAPIVAEPATPTKIELTAPIKVWIDDPKIVLDSLFLELAREVAGSETLTVLKALGSVATKFKARGPLISRNQLREVDEWASGHRQYLDTLILNPITQTKLISEPKEFLNAWQLPEQIRIAEGPHFAGILGGLLVYWTPFIDQQTLLVYKKAETREKRSRLSVKFAPGLENPENLSVREDCLAWAVDDTGVAEVHLQAGD